MLSTEPFTVTSAAYVRRMMKRLISRFTIPAVIAILGLLLLGVAVDAAFIIVALIAIFILVPTAMMFVYYLYALKPRTVMLSAGDVTVGTDDREVTVKVSRPEREDYIFTIPLADIREISPGNPFDIIVYGKQPDQFLLIDRNAFADDSARIQFHNHIFDRIPKNR